MTNWWIVSTDHGYITQRRLGADWSITPNVNLATTFDAEAEAWTVAILPGMAGRVLSRDDVAALTR